MRESYGILYHFHGYSMMKDQEFHEMLVVFTCLLLLGLESIGFSSWYFLQVSQNSYQVFKQTFISTVPLAISIFLIALITARTVAKKRADLGITLPETKSLIEYLKVSKTWILVLGVVIVMPIALTATVRLALHYRVAGVARRDPHNMMVYLLGYGPILTLTGVVGLIYAVIKRYRS